MPDKTLEKLLGKPDNELKSVLGEPELKKKDSSDSNGSQLTGSESQQPSQSPSGSQPVQTNDQQTNDQNVWPTETPMPFDNQIQQAPETPKLKLPTAQELFTQKAITKAKEKWGETGTFKNYPTPDEKINNINSQKNLLDNKYTELIKANPNQDLKALSESYQKELDESANKYGLIKQGDRYVVPKNDLEKYSKHLNDAIQEVQNEEGLKDKSFLKSAYYALTVGAAGVGADLSRVIESVIPYSNKLGLGDYYQQGQQIYAQKAKYFEDDIETSLKEGNWGAASGKAALNIIELVPLLISIAVGNEAGAGTQVIQGLALGEGIKKMEDIKDSDASQAAKIYSGIMTSLNFVALGTIGGNQIINNAKKLINEQGEQQAKSLFEKSYGTLFTNSAETLAKATSPALRGYAIGASTQLSNNLVEQATTNPNKDIMEGVNEAGITWALMDKAITFHGDIKNAKQTLDVAIGKVPKNIPFDDIARATGMVLEKDYLTKQNEGLDESFQTVNKNRIEDIKQKIEFITEPRVEKEKISLLNNEINGELAKENPNIEQIGKLQNELNTLEPKKAFPEDEQLKSLMKERDGLDPVEGKARKAEIDKELIPLIKDRQEVKQKFFDETIKGIDDPIDQDVYRSEKAQAKDELKGIIKTPEKAPKSEDKIDEYVPSETEKVTDQTPSSVIDKRLSGIKKDLFEEGKPSTEKKTTEEWMQTGKELVTSGQMKPKELVDNINKTPRPLGPEEVSGLIYYKTELDNRFDSVIDDIQKAKEKGNIEAETISKTELEGIQKELDNYRQMSIETAYLQGLSFNLRQAMLDSEYNLQSQIRKYKSVNNGEISPDVEAKFKDYADQLDILGKQLRDLEKQKEDRDSQDLIDLIAKGRKGKGKEKFGKDLIAEGASDLAQALGVIKMAVGDEKPNVSQALFKIGKGLLDEGLASAENVIQKIKEYVEDKFKGFNFEEYKDELEKSIKEVIPTINKGKLIIPNDLIKKYIDNGVTNIDDLTAHLKEFLYKDLPDITERQIRDAITGYGKEFKTTKNELLSKINEMKRVGKLISKLEDVKSNNLKAKQAKQRPRTDIENELRDKIKKSAKDLGIDLTQKTESERLELYKNNLKRAVKGYEERIKNKEFQPVVKREKPELDKEYYDLELKKQQIKEKFDAEYEIAKRANRTLTEKTKDIFIDVINLPKSLLASADLSAPLRQGAIFTLSNPRMGGRAMQEMFKQTFSSKKADRWLSELKISPEYQFMRESKLYISEPTAKLTAKEESFMTNIAKKIPIWGKIVSGSERAYTGYLNKLRVDAFNQGADELVKSGYDKHRDLPVFKSWANFVNNATGRGNLGPLEGSADVLNSFMFSPRLVASRFNLLNPTTYVKMPPEVRKMALKNMGTFIGVGTMTLALAAASGAEVEVDPRSSDFGKIKIGNTRFDIWAGFQQWVRSATQITTGQRKRTTTKEIVKLSGDKFPYESRLSIVGQFMRSKLAPFPALGINLLQGKGFAGEDITLAGTIYNEAIPLYLQDMKEIYQKEGWGLAVGSMIPGVFGVGTQYFDTSKSTIDAKAKEKQIKNFQKKHDPDGLPEKDLKEFKIKHPNEKIGDALFDKSTISDYAQYINKFDKFQNNASKKMAEMSAEDFKKYLDDNNLKEDFTYYNKNSSEISKLQKSITELKSITDKDEKQNAASAISEDMKKLSESYKNKEDFEISDEVKQIYDQYLESHKELGEQKKGNI